MGRGLAVEGMVVDVADAEQRAGLIARVSQSVAS
jgi:hypothetical protein